MTLSVALQHEFDSFSLDVTFQTTGGVTAIFGRSGAGKTTIVDAIGGLLRPQRGRIALGETVLVDTQRGVFVPKHKRRIGYVFQDGRLFPHLTVRQNLLFGHWFSPRAARQGSLMQVVDLLGIGHLLDRRPSRLSGGEKQRVAIGRALLANPALLLMDEPLTSLDEARKAEILPYLERLRDESLVPIVYVSHSIQEVVRLATNIVVVADGRITATGPPGIVMTDPSLFPAFGRHEAGAVLQASIAGHDAADGLSALKISGGLLTVPLVDAPLGSHVRIHIRARDIILATRPPQGISALNVLPVRIDQIGDLDAAIVDVRLACGGDYLLARVTRRSLRALGLESGQAVYAILKTVAVGRRDIGIVDAHDTMAMDRSD